MASSSSSSAGSSGGIGGDRQCTCPSRPPGRCKACRTKPKFGFLRSQRSLDLGGSLAGRHLSKEAEAARSRPQHVRRARSAERYEGLRVTNRSTTTGLARQTSLQTAMPITTASDRPPDYHRNVPPISSPPPPYEVAMGKLDLPPSYEEYLVQRMRQTQLSRASGQQPLPPPPPPQPAASSSNHLQQAQLCTCATCKAAGVLRVNLPQQTFDDIPRSLTEQRQLRVMLPPETNHDHCPCSKCQSRYGTYEDNSGNNDVLFSLDTTTAMQGVLTDGIALCNVM